MAAKLCFAAATLGAFFAPALGAVLSAVPTYKVDVNNILTSLAAFESKGLDDKDLEDVESSIQSLVTKDADPATRFAVKQLSDFMSKTLIPNRMKQQQQDQELLNSHLTELQNCAVEEQAKRDPLQRRDLRHADQHKEDYQDHMIKYGECVEELDSKVLLKDAYCHSIDEKKICHCHHSVVEHFGNRNVDCNSYPAIATENKKCCDSFAEHEKHHAACLKAHTDATFASKQHRIIMDGVCDMYDKCYDTNVKAFQETTELVKRRESHRAWGAVFRIECLIESFKSGKVSQSRATACKDKRANHKGLVFPTAPVKDVCNRNVHA
jgi:hypothetical protein